MQGPVATPHLDAVVRIGQQGQGSRTPTSSQGTSPSILFIPLLPFSHLRPYFLSTPPPFYCVLGLTKLTQYRAIKQILDREYGWSFIGTAVNEDDNWLMEKIGEMNT